MTTPAEGGSGPPAGRPAAGRAGTGRAERSAGGRSAGGRPGGERSGGERAKAERAGAERPRAERAGTERPKAERAGAERAGTERPKAERAGAERAGGGRPHFTGRAAVLAVVLCAVALSLAYPVREYLAQRRQIDMLLAQRQQIGQHLRRLEQEQAKLKTPAFIEEVARDQLHMCLPTQMCYVIIDPVAKRGKSVAARQAATPWYGRLWSSVQQADVQPTARRQGRAGRG